MSKSETGYWIKAKGNAKSELTEPETVVRGILKELGYGYRLQEVISVSVGVDSAEGVDSHQTQGFTATLGERVRGSEVRLTNARNDPPGKESVVLDLLETNNVGRRLPTREVTSLPGPKGEGRFAMTPREPTLTLTIDLFIPEHRICVEDDDLHREQEEGEAEDGQRASDDSV